MNDNSTKIQGFASKADPLGQVSKLLKALRENDTSAATGILQREAQESREAAKREVEGSLLRLAASSR
jgi:hypothetical protein